MCVITKISQDVSHFRFSFMKTLLLKKCAKNARMPKCNLFVCVKTEMRRQLDEFNGRNVMN